jgi:PIN domain nuclease of toxin-antitoxin system
MSGIRTPQIPPKAAGAALSPEQKRFNTLIRQIEQARRTLADWQTNIPPFRQAHAQALRPLQTSFMAARREWAFALDALLGQPSWTRAERAFLQELVCATAGELLEEDGDDAALKALFDKHNEIDFDTDKQEDLQALKELTEVFTGLDLGDSASIRTDDDLFRRMHEGMAAQAAAAAAERAAKSQRRRKTAAQQRQEAEAQLATQSVREIYRKLASAVHPDRETDPTRREAKTALMQKINQAYAANDLLTLLEVQLQIEQVDASHITNASAQRLKHYNKVLAEQLAGLKAEIAHVQTELCIDFDLEPDSGMNPSRLSGLIDQHLRLGRSELARLQRDLRMLADKAATKRWLKQQLRLQREASLYEDFF